MDYTAFLGTRSPISVTGLGVPLLIILVILYYFRKDTNKKGKGLRRVPGLSWPLPFIGNLHQIGSDGTHLVYKRWKEKYGGLTSFNMAGQNTMIVSNFKMMKELLSTAMSPGRPHSDFFRAYSPSSEGQGILLADGRKMEQQRAFVVKTLSELGLSTRGILEGNIYEQVNTLVKVLEDKGGKAFQANRMFNGAVVATLWGIVSGEKSEWVVNGELRQPEINKLSCAFASALNAAMNSGLFVIKWLKYLPSGRSTWNSWVNTIRDFHGLVEAAIEKHVGTVDEYSPRDFIDYWLIKMAATTDPHSTFYKDAGRSNLKVAVGELFIAGSETTGSALEYSMLLTACHPEAQARVHAELDRVVGNRRPTLSDRKSLPYTQACIMETLRRTPVAAGAAYRITDDVEFHGMFIPKDTVFVSDFYNVLRDPDIWGHDVDVFRPERFLNEDGTDVVKHEALIPFSMGRRRCPGEPLAMDTIFLFYSSILQHFRIEPADPPGSPKGFQYDFDNIEVGLTTSHKDFHLKFHKRRE